MSRSHFYKLSVSRYRHHQVHISILYLCDIKSQTQREPPTHCYLSSELLNWVPFLSPSFLQIGTYNASVTAAVFSRMEICKPQALRAPNLHSDPGTPECSNITELYHNAQFGLESSTPED